MLVGCREEMLQAGALPASRRDQVEIAAWSAVHGLACLLLDGPLRVIDPDGADRLIGDVIAVVQRGL